MRTVEAGVFGAMEMIGLFVARFVADDSGQDLLEYALLAAVVGSVGAGLFPLMQEPLKALFSGRGNAIKDLWIPNDPS